jgi:hypothetical protein
VAPAPGCCSASNFANAPFIIDNYINRPLPFSTPLAAKGLPGTGHVVSVARPVRSGHARSGTRDRTASQGRVSRRQHRLRHNLAILATIERRFDLEPLSSRDAAVNDLSHVFRAHEPDIDT